MPQNRITLTLRSASDDRTADIEFSEFVPALEAVRRSLRNTEAIKSEAQPTLNWQVVDLSHSSPASITIGCVDHEQDLVRAEVVTEKYIEYWNAIVVEERIPDEIPTDRLTPFKYLTKRVKDDKLRISISNGVSSTRVEVSERSDAVMEYALSDKRTTIGSVKGMLEAANFHGDSFGVRIYPAFGPNVIRGMIPKGMARTAAAALQHHVRVHGVMTYLARDKFASSITIDEIFILDDEPLPTLKDLKGSMPGILNDDQTSEDFIRELRDAE